MKNIIDLRKEEPRQTVGVLKSATLEIAKYSEISGEIHPHQQTAHKPSVIIISTSFILIALAYLYFQRNILTAIFFSLISFIILVFVFKEKKIILWEINKHGVTVDNSFFPYRELKSFWIEYQPGYIKEISLKSKKWYQGYFKIPLNQENPLQIRETLLDFLPEERHEDTLVETINRKLGI